jgi:hypothetical protein
MLMGVSKPDEADIAIVCQQLANLRNALLVQVPAEMLAVIRHVLSSDAVGVVPVLRLGIVKASVRP